MQLNYHQLHSYLNNIKANTLPRFFWLNSEDSYLLQDAHRAIKTAIKQLGYSERIIFYIETSTSWEEIINTIKTPNLFHNQQIIELHFTNKITATEQEKLLKIATILADSKTTIGVISYPFRMESRVLKQKWMNQLNNYGIITTIWPLSPTDYPKWLKQQIQKYQVTFSEPQLFDFFCQRTMCNPNIAAQTLYKLKLQDFTRIDHSLLAATLDEHANYDVFNLVDSYLINDSKQCAIILKILKQNHAEPLLILWALRKELLTLANIYEEAAATKQMPSQILKNLKLWTNKTNLLAIALNKYNLNLVYQALQKIADLEILIKTEYNLKFIWQQMHTLFITSA